MIETIMSVEMGVKDLTIVGGGFSFSKEGLSKIKEWISGNYFVESCCIQQSLQTHERFRNTTRRNLYLKNQQRFKKVKPAL